jgi:hypothetical protein
MGELPPGRFAQEKAPPDFGGLEILEEPRIPGGGGRVANQTPVEILHRAVFLSFGMSKIRSGRLASVPGEPGLARIGFGTW